LLLALDVGVGGWSLQVAPQHAALSSSTGSAVTDSKDNANLSALELQSKGSVRHAVTSRKGLVPYNKNKVNQDRFVFKYAVADDPGVSMWGVMDGHGEYGHYVAAFVQENLPACLALEKGLRAKPEEGITRATAAMCKRLQETDINVSNHTANTKTRGRRSCLFICENLSRTLGALRSRFLFFFLFSCFACLFVSVPVRLLRLYACVWCSH
jgi:hypothetical protein